MTDAKDLPTLPDHVQMQPVESHHHSRFGYDPDAAHLYIDFARDGKPPNIYRYENVTPEAHAAYAGAESKGKHFIANIKGNAAFPFTKVAHVAKP